MTVIRGSIRETHVDSILCTEFDTIAHNIG